MLYFPFSEATPFYTYHIPGGDHEGYVDVHVRRLETLRRTGIAGRINVDQWRIPDGLVSHVAAYDVDRDSQASVHILSPVGLNRQIGSDGAIWLDRRLIHDETANLTPTNFGQQAREAVDQCREHHIEQGNATRNQDSCVFYRRNLLAILQECKIAGVGSNMASNRGLPLHTATDGGSINGKLTGTMYLSSGKLAVVEKSHESAPVPWRPITDHQLGHEIMGIV